MRANEEVNFFLACCYLPPTPTVFPAGMVQETWIFSCCSSTSIVRAVHIRSPVSARRGSSICFMHEKWCSLGLEENVFLRERRARAFVPKYEKFLPLRDPPRALQERRLLKVYTVALASSVCYDDSWMCGVPVWR